MCRVGEREYEAIITYRNGDTITVKNEFLSTIKTECRPYVRNKEVILISLRKVYELTPLKFKI